MRNDDDRAFIGLEELLQPEDGFDVQVVRWLIQKEEVGTLEQHFCQLDSHLPATAELVGEAGKVALFEAQALEDFLCFCLCVHPIEHVVMVVKVGHFVQQIHVAVAFVVRAVRQFLMDFGEALLDAFGLVEGCHRFVNHGFSLRNVHLLVQKTKRGGRWPLDVPLVRAYVASDDFEQSGLASTVSAYQTDALLVTNGEADMVEEGTVSVFNENICG